MTRKPEYYRTPLQSRSDIAAFLIDSTKQRSYDGRNHPFCFNVKLYDLDMSYDHLLGIVNDCPAEFDLDDATIANEVWLAGTKEKFAEVENSLCEWALEVVRRDFVSDCQDGKLDNDTYTHLWDGTKLAVTYSLEGRSCGWLSINEFQGHSFGSLDGEEMALLLSGHGGEDSSEVMDFKTLRQLYQLVVKLLHDLTYLEKEVEYQAARTLFVNICDDVPTKGKLPPPGATYYVWKEYSVVEGYEQGGSRLLTPHADPHKYEFPIDFLFDSEESAYKGLKEWGVEQEAYDEGWVLCQETTSPIVTLDSKDKPEEDDDDT